MLNNPDDLFATDDHAEANPETYTPSRGWYDEDRADTTASVREGSGKAAKRPGERVLRRGRFYWCGD